MNRTERLALLGGVLYPLLALGGLVLMLPALPGDFSGSPEKVADHLRDTDPTALTWLGLGLEYAGLVALFAFAARISDLADEPWLRQWVTGLALSGVTIKVASFIPALVALRADDLDEESLALLMRLNDSAVGISDAMLAGFAISAGPLLLGRVPWLGWFGVAAGVGSLVDLAVGTGLPSLALLVWFIVTGLVLTRRLSAADTEARPRTLV